MSEPRDPPQSPAESVIGDWDRIFFELKGQAGGNADSVTLVYLGVVAAILTVALKIEDRLNQ